MCKGMCNVLVSAMRSFILVTPFILTVLFWKMEFICGCGKIKNLTSQMESSYSDVDERKVF